MKGESTFTNNYPGGWVLFMPVTVGYIKVCPATCHEDWEWE